MVKIAEQLDAVLHQEMDRKNFLRYGGTILLAVLGISGFVRVLLRSKDSFTSNKNQPTSSHGYGSSRYGE
jgi:hypothetical protein